MQFARFYEMAANFDQDEFTVIVNAKYKDQPELTIPGWGTIRLFLSGGPFAHWVVHMIRGERDGAATLLYFAALQWALTNGDAIFKGRDTMKTYGQIASDSTLSPDAVRARARFESMYSDYIYIMPHPNADSVKVHRGDGTDWRRPPNPGESSMWRLKKMPPWRFHFTL